MVFCPKKEKELEKALSKIARFINFAIIFFIPGLKVNFYLKKFKEFTLIIENILIAREITKVA